MEREKIIRNVLDSRFQQREAQRSSRSEHTLSREHAAGYFIILTLICFERKWGGPKPEDETDCKVDQQIGSVEQNKDAGAGQEGEQRTIDWSGNWCVHLHLLPTTFLYLLGRRSKILLILDLGGGFCLLQTRLQSIIQGFLPQQVKRSGPGLRIRGRRSGG